MKISDKILRAAIRSAEKSEFRQRLGAVVFSNKKVISTGFNKPKSHPITKKFKFGTIHAEIDALLNCREDAEGKDIMVVRLLKRQEFGISKPCIMCKNIIESFKINRVFYFNRNGEIEFDFANKLKVGDHKYEEDIVAGFR